jgi:hypothetical protein
MQAEDIFAAYNTAGCNNGTGTGNTGANPSNSTSFTLPATLYLAVFGEDQRSKSLTGFHTTLSENGTAIATGYTPVTLR